MQEQHSLGNKTVGLSIKLLISRTSEGNIASPNLLSEFLYQFSLKNGQVVWADKSGNYTTLDVWHPNEVKTSHVEDIERMQKHLDTKIFSQEGFC